MTNVKLSEKQKEVILKMRKGWHIESYHKYFKVANLQWKNDPDKWERIRLHTFHSLVRLDLIYILRENKYYLTDLGKSLPIK